MNAQGDVIALFDTNGTAVATYTYDAWGNCEVCPTAVIDNNRESEYNKTVANLNPIRYRSYYFDTETGFYWLQARFYDPATGRFVSQDEYCYLDPDSVNGINLFAYCNNNPVTGYDPTGTFDWKKFWKGFAIVAVAIVTVVAVTAITVASCGTAAPVLLGAAIGAGVNAGISAVVQSATSDTIDWGKFAVDIAVGGIMGAFGGSVIGLVGMTIAGGVVGAAGSVAENWVTDQPINVADAVIAGAFGALTAFIGGAGAQHGQTEGRRAALAVGKQIRARNAAGGYRHVTNFNFAVRSNHARLTRATRLLNRTAIHSIIESTANTFELNLMQYLAFNLS